jgi:uncharacterized membrane protein YqjE
VEQRPQRTRIDPDVGIPDLIRRLTDDSKRLANDEVRLAKLEIGESIHTGARGTLRLAIAFGAGVVAATALTIALATIIGRLVDGNYWVGALVVGVVELALAYWLIRSGLKELGKPSYSFEETREALKGTRDTLRGARESLKDTTTWMTTKRGD